MNLFESFDSIHEINKYLVNNPDGIISIEAHPAQEQVFRLFLRPIRTFDEGLKHSNIMLIINPRIEQGVAHFNYPDRTETFVFPGRQGKEQPYRPGTGTPI